MYEPQACHKTSNNYLSTSFVNSVHRMMYINIIICYPRKSKYVVFEQVL